MKMSDDRLLPVKWAKISWQELNIVNYTLNGLRISREELNYVIIKI